VLVVGRDLRAITAIQQRFLDAQRELERGYWRTRQAEARYRQLFQVATDAVVVVDAQTLRVIEANPSAAQLFDLAPQALPGRRVGQLFARTSRPAVEHLLVSARASGREAEVHAQLLGRVGRVAVSATPFRADDTMRLLVRVRADERQRDAVDVANAIARLVDGTRDGVVVTDSGGRILHANPAFVALVGEPGEDAVRGQPLSRWLVGERGEPSGVLAAARAQGVVRRIAAALQGARGSTTPVEVSAALLTEGDRECVGVVLNTRGTHQMLDVWPGDALRLALDRLIAQVGETTLPALLREASDLAQRHFIALALQQAGGDAAAAARRLGISRASLRRRQRRLAGTPPAPTDAPASDGQTP
jgi:transcriptional regulator PpsR